MFENHNIEQQIEKNENKIRLAELQIESLDKEIAQFISELKVTPQKLSVFIENQNNFTPANWDTLQQERKTLDEKLSRNLKNIRNPLQAKKAYAERKIDPRWLFVK